MKSQYDAQRSACQALDEGDVSCFIALWRFFSVTRALDLIRRKMQSSALSLPRGSQYARKHRGRPSRWRFAHTFTMTWIECERRVQLRSEIPIGAPSLPRKNCSSAGRWVCGGGAAKPTRVFHRSWTARPLGQTGSRILQWLVRCGRTSPHRSRSRCPASRSARLNIGPSRERPGASCMRDFQIASLRTAPSRTFTSTTAVY